MASSKLCAGLAELDRSWTMEMVQAANEFLDIEQDAAEAMRQARERVQKRGIPAKPITPERASEIEEIVALSRTLARMPEHLQHAAQLEMLAAHEGRDAPPSVESPSDGDRS